MSYHCFATILSRKCLSWPIVVSGSLFRLRPVLDTIDFFLQFCSNTSPEEVFLTPARNLIKILPIDERSLSAGSLVSVAVAHGYLHAQPLREELQAEGRAAGRVVDVQREPDSFCVFSTVRPYKTVSCTKRPISPLDRLQHPHHPRRERRQRLSVAERLRKFHLVR